MLTAYIADEQGSIHHACTRDTVAEINGWLKEFAFSLRDAKWNEVGEYYYVIDPRE